MPVLNSRLRPLCTTLLTRSVGRCAVVLAFIKYYRHSPQIVRCFPIPKDRGLTVSGDVEAGRYGIIDVIIPNTRVFSVKGRFL